MIVAMIHENRLVQIASDDADSTVCRGSFASLLREPMESCQPQSPAMRGYMAPIDLDMLEF